MCVHHGLRVIILALAGCATSASYLYSPQGATYWSDGYPAASNAVPPESPQGRVDVTSFGVVEIKPDGVAPITTLHVRLTIINDGDATPWAITPSDQQVELAGMGRSRPIYVNSDMPSLPTITIAQRERRMVDFYYALPPGIDDNDELPGFEVLWQVTTPARAYSSRTRFQRIEQQPATADVHVVHYAGWGPYWWFDPLYPRLVFIHHRPIVVHRHGRVIITRPPVRQHRVIRDHRR